MFQLEHHYSMTTEERARRTREEVKKRDCYIVCRGTEYLVGRICWAKLELMWSIYYFDAWRTKDKRAAEMVAQKFGAEVVRFNPILGEVYS